MRFIYNKSLKINIQYTKIIKTLIKTGIQNRVHFVYSVRIVFVIPLAPSWRTYAVDTQVNGTPPVLLWTMRLK